MVWLKLYHNARGGRGGFLSAKEGSTASLNVTSQAPRFQQDMQDMYSEAIGKGAKFLEAPVSGSKVRQSHYGTFT